MWIDKLYIIKLVGILYREIRSSSPDWDRVTNLITELYTLVYNN